MRLRYLKNKVWEEVTDLAIHPDETISQLRQKIGGVFNSPTYSILHRFLPPPPHLA